MAAVITKPTVIPTSASTILTISKPLVEIIQITLDFFLTWEGSLKSMQEEIIALLEVDDAYTGETILEAFKIGTLIKLKKLFELPLTEIGIVKKVLTPSSAPASLVSALTCPMPTVSFKIPYQLECSLFRVFPLIKAVIKAELPKSDVSDEFVNGIFKEMDELENVLIKSQSEREPDKTKVTQARIEAQLAISVMCYLNAKARTESGEAKKDICDQILSQYALIREKLIKMNKRRREDVAEKGKMWTELLVFRAVKNKLNIQQLVLSDKREDKRAEGIATTWNEFGAIGDEVDDIERELIAKANKLIDTLDELETERTKVEGICTDMCRFLTPAYRVCTQPHQTLENRDERCLQLDTIW